MHFTFSFVQKGLKVPVESVRYLTNFAASGPGFHETFWFRKLKEAFNHGVTLRDPVLSGEVHTSTHISSFQLDNLALETFEYI